ncbi:sulfatase-like hydrolase/transferase [Fulvivirgaceae bacterium BMA10]|uniref:Sulfatase-like hydrolase/transferase n=1 Tax=Splendidivirga corallicola TaxID=3051826 RepID=A0ABT8KQ39_9BACT|nr:sulfatase-like hydrolase/transferase [Fulvivirgaceae bacterium BMA10]
MKYINTPIPQHLNTFLLLIFFLTSCQHQQKTQGVTQEDQHPNIILIMADDQGWGDTGYNGHPYLKTPNLDAMVAEGVQFNRFYAAAPVCSPTRGSVMTGRHPSRYGICSANCGHIKKEEITMAEWLKERGYATGHFGKWHLGTLTKKVLDGNRGGKPEQEAHYAPPWEHGFDVCFSTESKVPTWDPMVTPNVEAGGVKKTLVEGGPYGTYYWTGPERMETNNLEGDDSRVIMDRAVPFIEDAVSSNKSFFTIIWFHTPHLPVLTSQKYREPYLDLSEDEQHYYGCITAMDEQVGRLRSKLEALGVAENTMIWYTSDNGPEGGTRTGRNQGTTKGLKGRKRSLYDGGTRVPGILVWPAKIKKASIVDVPCFTSDYFPTIMASLNESPTDLNRPFDGQDITGIYQGRQQERSNYIAHSYSKQLSLMDNRYKLYRKNEDQEYELYDLINDPGEQQDLAKQKPDQLQEMVNYLNDWKSSVEKSAEGKDYGL